MNKRERKKYERGSCVTAYCRGKLSGHNRHCSKCMMRRWRAKYPVKAAYASLRYRAKTRGIPFTISLGQFTELVAASDYLTNRAPGPAQLQIDRIDARIGYVWGNCQVLTCSENSSKGNYERGNNEDNFPY